MDNVPAPYVDAMVRVRSTRNTQMTTDSDSSDIGSYEFAIRHFFCSKLAGNEFAILLLALLTSSFYGIVGNAANHKLAKSVSPIRDFGRHAFQQPLVHAIR
jgi:hypothetical protein